MTCNSTVPRHPGKGLLTNLSINLHGSKINIACETSYQCNNEGWCSPYQALWGYMDCSDRGTRSLYAP